MDKGKDKVNGKRFNQTSSTILDKIELRSLSSNNERYLYSVLRLSNYLNYIGLFKVPFTVLKEYAFLDLDKLYECLNELKLAGLIDFDTESEHIRLINYFDKVNRPDNPSVAKRMVNDFYDLEGCSASLLIPAGLELIDCIKSISISWKGCKELKAEVLEGFESWLIALDPKSYEQEYEQRREQGTMLPRYIAILDHEHSVDNVDTYNTIQDDMTLENTIFKQN